MSRRPNLARTSAPNVSTQRRGPHIRGLRIPMATPPRRNSRKGTVAAASSVMSEAGVLDLSFRDGVELGDGLVDHVLNRLVDVEFVPALLDLEGLQSVEL